MKAARKKNTAKLQMKEVKRQVAKSASQRKRAQAGARFRSGASIPRLRSETHPKMRPTLSLSRATQEVLTTHSMSYELHEDSIIVRHTEAVTDVLQSQASNGSFSLNMYNLNPGLPLKEGGTFPLLSGIAGNFQKYRWRRAKFFYKTQSGTDTRGLVMLSFSYENDASPPSSSIVLRSMSGTVQGPPWAESLTSSLDCKAFHSGEPYSLVRVSEIPDLDEYDNGFLIVATQGCAPSDTEPLGSLWVEYEIELCKPRALDDVVYQRGATSAYGLNASLTFPKDGSAAVLRGGKTLLEQIPGMKLNVDATAPQGNRYYLTVDKDMETMLSYNVPVEAVNATGEAETRSHGDISFEFGPDTPGSSPDSTVSDASRGFSLFSAYNPAAFPSVVSTSLSNVSVALLKGYRYYCIAKNSSYSVNSMKIPTSITETANFLFTFSRLLSPRASLLLAVARAGHGQSVPEHLAILAPVQQAQREYLSLKSSERKLDVVLEDPSESDDVDFCEPRPHENPEEKARRRRNALKKLSHARD